MATFATETCTRRASSSSATTKKELDQLLKLNNKGAKLLQSKRYGKAVTALTSCLAKTKDLVASTSTVPENTNGDAYSFLFLAASQDTFYSHSADSTEAVSSSYIDGVFDGSLQILVDDTLSVKQRRKAAMPLSRSLSMISAAVLYNLGLAFHLGSLKDERNQEASITTKHQARLKKALTLYEAAHSILKEGNDLNKASTSTNDKDTRMTAVPQIQWHVMERLIAILNNVGHIHSVLGRIHEQNGCRHDLHREQAKKCQEEILSNLIAVDSVDNRISHFSGYRYSSSGDTQGQGKKCIFCFDLFFQNAIVCVLTPSPSAEAA